MIAHGVVADGCIIADDSLVPAGQQLFRDVVATAGPTADVMRDLPVSLRENASVALFRRMSGFFGRPAWSRTPAAQ